MFDTIKIVMIISTIVSLGTAVGVSFDYSDASYKELRKQLARTILFLLFFGPVMWIIVPLRGLYRLFKTAEISEIEVLKSFKKKEISDSAGDVSIVDDESPRIRRK